MDPHWKEWISLLVRWLHVITGIAWIGSSFFFNWMNGSFRAGKLWMVHGGAFYQVEMLKIAPDEIPPMLHWFKWEAYFTWISGFILLGLVYYMGGGIYLTDPAVATISTTMAVAIGIGSLVIGWIVYDLLWNSPLQKQTGLLVIVSVLLAVAGAWGLSQTFSGRAAYIHVGAILGTLMAANVFFRIIPAQRQLVAATKAGQPADEKLAARAKQRSLHNNYMTLPVLFVMISSHYPSTYGNKYNWIILAILALGSAMVRHFFNLRNQGKAKQGVWIFPAVVAGLIFLILWTTPKPVANLALPKEAMPVPFTKARAIIEQRCLRCHSAHPTSPIFITAPNGFLLDTPEQIGRQAEKIKERAVLNKTMPLANETKMTDEERALLGRWIDQGAKINE